jgi:hypothetical protein
VSTLRGETHAGDRAAQPRHLLQAFPPLPPADLRQGRAVPPDPEKFLARQDPPATKKQLQAQLDRFTAYYNQIRPHRAIGRRTPAAAFAAREKAHPTGPRIDATGYRVRHDKLDKKGTVTLRHQGRLHHIPAGRPYRGWRIILLVADLEVQVIGLDGSQLRRLTLDPAKDYQPLG